MARNKINKSSEPIYFKLYGSGRPLLLIHGLMVTGEMFEPVIKDLSKHHRLIVPDLRGSGKSRKMSPPYTVKKQAQDLALLLKKLHIKAADVLGYSQGGAVAQQLAIDYPKLVSRLILSNTYAYNMASFGEWMEGHMVPIIIRIVGIKRFARLLSMGFKNLPKESTAAVLRSFADQDQGILLTQWKEAMIFDSRKQLRRIRCPTLVIAGEKDAATPMHHAKMLNQGIVNSKLVIIKGADHAFLWAHPDRFVSTVSTFLD